MRPCPAILAALFCALSLSAHAQAIVGFEDLYWVVQYGSNQYGLVQYSYPYGAGFRSTSTTVCLGSRSHTFNTSVWPILAALVAVLAAVVWLAIYGIGSFTPPAKKHPPPSTQSPV